MCSGTLTSTPHLEPSMIDTNATPVRVCISVGCQVVHIEEYTRSRSLLMAYSFSHRSRALLFYVITLSI